MDLYLASGSPRRAQLLAQIGFSISKIASDIDETPQEGELALAYTERMALQKSAQALALFSATHGTPPVLTADTSVAIDGLILGKPDNHAHAVAMLHMLSGPPTKSSARWWCGTKANEAKSRKSAKSPSGRLLKPKFKPM